MWERFAAGVIFLSGGEAITRRATFMSTTTMANFWDALSSRRKRRSTIGVRREEW
jgi:hypothetical protein